jgi:hypothetical protein
MSHIKFERANPVFVQPGLNKILCLMTLLVCTLVLFVNLGTTLSASQQSSNGILINYYSPNLIAFELNRFDQSKIEERIKQKRSTLFALPLYLLLGAALDLKIQKNVGLILAHDFTSYDNLKYKYLLLDLPPPFSPI